jgi:DNA repair protein RadC
LEPASSNKSQKWQHPGGKLRELGGETLTDAELLFIFTAQNFASASFTTSGKRL